MARGGYRKPANPAPVSGPGAMSRRTDGKQPVMNIGGGAYGESQNLRQIQGGAPMAQTKSSTSVKKVTPPAKKVTPLFSPTERPNEPLTEGMPFGPGANSLGLKNGAYKPTLKQTILRALENSDDEDLETAYHYLQMRGEV